MTAAVRVLREELVWLEVAIHRAAGDLNNDRIPAGLVARQLRQLVEEMAEIRTALQTLGDRQMRLPFEARAA